MSDHQIHTGDDGETAYLLTVWDSGAIDIATRPVDGGTRAVWSPPTRLQAQPLEVPC